MQGLDEFMAAVGASGRDVSRATGLSDSTISRARRVNNPHWSVVRKILRWAESAAAEQGIDWQSFFEEKPARTRKRRAPKAAAS